MQGIQVERSANAASFGLLIRPADILLLIVKTLHEHIYTHIYICIHTYIYIYVRACLKVR